MERFKVRQPTIASGIIQKIRELLADGTYEPGDKLPTETELARTFGVSRASVRQALKTLTYLGILESRPAKGTFVTRATDIYKDVISWAFLMQPSELMCLLDYREAIEAHSMRLLARRHAVDPASVEPILETMKMLCARMKEYTVQYEYGKLTDIDYEFHKLIVSASGNPHFATVFALLGSHLRDEIRAVNKARILHGDLSRISEEHLILVDSICTGNPVLAQDTLYKHLDEVRAWLQKSLGGECAR